MDSFSPVLLNNKRKIKEEQEMINKIETIFAVVAKVYINN